MRYLDIWHESVRAFDSVPSGSPEERALYAAVNIALPVSLRWRWPALADALGCNVRTLRRDARRPEVRALAEAGRLRMQGVRAMLALRLGMSKLAATAARGEPEAVVALAQATVALGLGEKTLEPLHVSRRGRASLETPEAAEALAAVLAKLAEEAASRTAEGMLEPPDTGAGSLASPEAAEALAETLPRIEKASPALPNQNRERGHGGGTPRRPPAVFAHQIGLPSACVPRVHLEQGTRPCVSDMRLLLVSRSQLARHGRSCVGRDVSTLRARGACIPGPAQVTSCTE
jgi:hypothetical protein